MNQSSLLPVNLCNYYGHEFVKALQIKLGQRWDREHGMIDIYRNICARCDHWYHIDSDGEIVEMAD